ncbi:MAG TPA: GFA family protein [Hyphomicrobiaceae bacterium]|nr:GFA family protein [Hyphomicrobiaceae bacterium]
MVAEAHSGRCTCGAVTYRIMAAPIFVNCCHCTWCQRETGSAFAINAMIEADRVEVMSGAPEQVLTPSNSGKGQRIWRCPSCRVALWSNYPGAGPSINFVRVGTLEAPHPFVPGAHIFTSTKVAWVVVPEGVPSFAEFYDAATMWSADGLARFKAARSKHVAAG